MSTEGERTLMDIVDMGGIEPEPTEHYMESVNMLDNVVRECIYVSRGYGGIPSPHGRHFYGSALFTAMITRGLSLLMLAPHSPWTSKQIEHWDYSSMTGIARTMIELRVAFYYLCTEKCSDDEWYFRWNLFNLHDCTSRIRMFDALGQAEQVESFKEQAEELRDRLTSSPFFETIEPKQRKKLLHGQTAYLFPLEAIAESAGIERSVFQWLYILFSTHVHALPMSFYRLGGDYPERGRGLPSEAEEGYSSLCLTLSATLLVATRDEVHELFEGLKLPGDPSVEARDGAPEPPSLAVGEERSHELSDEITMRFRRAEEDVYITTLIHRPSGAEVLERADREEGGAEILYFDPYFWTTSLDGGPATEAELEKAISDHHAFRIDPEKREIHFKSDGIAAQ